VLPGEVSAHVERFLQAFGEHGDCVTFSGTRPNVVVCDCVEAGVGGADVACEGHR